jgi:prepilin-type N-terminal cleavage/methylation domain-containing protein
MIMRSLMRRNAFTLVELLVVIVIMGVISSMVVIALSGAQRQAQEKRAQGMIDRLNLLILRLYEEESRSRYSVGGGIASSVIPLTSGRPDPAGSNNRTQMIWNRDWLRVSLPDRIADLSTDAAAIQHIEYSVNPLENTTQPYRIFQVFNIDFGAASRRDARRNIYRNRAVRSIAALAGSNTWTAPASWAEIVDGDVTNGEWTREYESAECLYLILASQTIDGQPASESLRPRDIGDLDGDGMPEILDPWGTPVAFIRWPVGFYLAREWKENPTNTMLEERKAKLGPDYQDVLKTDPRFATISLTDDTFQLLPIVVSAGSDGLFDLYGADELATPISPIFYGTMTWTLPPITTSPITFPDPYRDGASIDTQLGYPGDFVEIDTDNSSDNVYPSLSFQ